MPTQVLDFVIDLLPWLVILFGSAVFLASFSIALRKRHFLGGRVVMYLAIAVLAISVALSTVLVDWGNFIFQRIAHDCLLILGFALIFRASVIIKNTSV